jgi:hypothetical protein
MDDEQLKMRRERISLAAEIIARHHINPLHAAISMRSWADTERHANAIRDRLQRAIFDPVRVDRIPLLERLDDAAERLSSLGNVALGNSVVEAAILIGETLSELKRLAALDVYTEADGSQWVRREDISTKDPANV